MPLLKQTFRELAATWYYQGIESIDLTFKEPTLEDAQLDMARKVAQNGTVGDLEGYLVVVLERAIIPGVAEYTLTGK